MRRLALLLALGLSTPLIPAAMAPAAAAPARAASCDNPRTDFDNLYCERKVFMQADSDLNLVYNKLRARLNPADKRTLLTAQRGWIRERDAECSMTEDDNIRVNIECAKTKTIARTNWLNDRLRECTSSGCRSSRLRD